MAREILACIRQDAGLRGELRSLLEAEERPADEWLDTKHAAEYTGMHPDTLTKKAREGQILSEQDGSNAKRFFRRSELDRYRASGGRSPASTLLPHSSKAA